MPVLPIQHWANAAVSWMVHNLHWLFSIITTIFKHLDGFLSLVLSTPSWFILLAVFVLLAIVVRGIGFAMGTALGGLLIQDMTLWTTTMHTLALVITAGVFALLVGIPVGIWAGQARRVSTVVRPILDVMQTMPIFVYLIPAVLFLRWVLSLPYLPPLSFLCPLSSA